jgi:hypothetical protein
MEYGASQMIWSVRWHTQKLASSQVIDLLPLFSIESLKISRFLFQQVMCRLAAQALLLTLTQGCAGLWEFSHRAVRIFTQCFDGAPRLHRESFPFRSGMWVASAGNGNPKLERQEQRLGCSTDRLTQGEAEARHQG